MSLDAFMKQRAEAKAALNKQGKAAVVDKSAFKGLKTVEQRAEEDAFGFSGTKGTAKGGKAKVSTATPSPGPEDPRTRGP